MAYEPDSTYGEVTKPSKEQEAYTASHAMTRDDFIKKYALGDGGTFVANDKGGNAASEVAGQNVADYYDTYLSKDAKQTQTLRSVEGDTREVPIEWGGGRYSNTHPYFDGYDNVNPHPESNRGNGLDEAWKAVRPLAAIGAMAYGGWALSGTGAATGAGASGLAGSLGMNAGAGATALNAGALNTGISLAQGKNIGDSLKSGAMAAALSPVGGWAKGEVGAALADSGLPKFASNAIASTAAGAATGAAGAAMTGQDVGKGLAGGIISGAVGAVGGAAGGLAKTATGSDFAGMVASTAAKSAITGKSPNIPKSIINWAVNDNTMDSVNKFLGFAADQQGN